MCEGVCEGGRTTLAGEPRPARRTVTRPRQMITRPSVEAVTPLGAADPVETSGALWRTQRQHVQSFKSCLVKRHIGIVFSLFLFLNRIENRLLQPKMYKIKVFIGRTECNGLV